MSAWTLPSHSTMYRSRMTPEVDIIVTLKHAGVSHLSCVTIQTITSFMPILFSITCSYSGRDIGELERTIKYVMSHLDWRVLRTSSPSFGAIFEGSLWPTSLDVPLHNHNYNCGPLHVYVWDRIHMYTCMGFSTDQLSSCIPSTC